MQTLHHLRYTAALHLSGAPSLVLDGVSVRYDGAVALDGVSFELGQGERVAVVGPNGAGKSTLFKVIAGLLRPTAGSLRIFGQPPGEHLCVAYVPQRSQVDWNFPVTVADVVMMGRSGKIGLFRWPHKHDWQVVEAALERVRMQDLAQRRIGELSGGQQQRVFLARALAQEAELLLLDEPLNGLDAPSQQAIFEVLDALKALGITVLVATHDLDQAAAQFDRMMLLNRRLVVFGPPAQVLTPTHLLAAYGGHLHLLPGGEAAEGQVLLADTCCEGE
jgi:manganese/iron transport system ATP-binding protein